MKTALNPISIRAAAWTISLLIAFAAPAVATSATTLTVRIMEGRVADRVTVTAPVPLRASFAGGACEGSSVIVSVGPAGTFVLSCGDATTTAPAPLTIAPVSGSTILTVTTPTDEHRYRGTLTLSVEDGVIVLINAVPLEEYLLSVVPAELTTTERAALEAQAILCRTFAVKNRGRHGGWDLCDLTHCQHYAGVETETAAGTRAVTETEGLIVTYGGAPAEVFYHSSSGGATTSPAYVWGGPPIPYLAGVRDAVNGRDLSAVSPDAEWSFTVEKRRLHTALTEAVGLPVTGIAVADRDPSGRAAAVRLSGASRVLSGEEFRIIVCRRFGWGSLKSTLFDVREAGGSYVFSGRGLGHGVGMSQWGALELARMGRDYRRIIEFYFPGTQIGPFER
jgi:stage II sporulation protein D